MRERRRLRRGGRLLLGLLLAGGLLVPVGAGATITARPEFLVTPFAATLWAPVAVACGGSGPLGPRLYVVERAPGEATGRLVAFAPRGLATVLASGLQRPTDLVVSTEGAWGNFPYVLEGQESSGVGLRVTPVNALGPTVPFPLPPGGAQLPGGLALSTGGRWGEALYVSDAAEAQILRLEPTGAVRVVLKGLSGPRALALAPPGSLFGEALYVVTGGAVLRVEVDGETSVLVDNLETPSALAFGPGGTLGDELYLTEGGLAGGRLLRISPVGVITPIAEGFGVIGGLALAADPPFGPAIFVADFTARIIYRLTPVRP